MKNKESKKKDEMKFGDFERQVCSFGMYCPKLS